MAVLLDNVYVRTCSNVYVHVATCQMLRLHVRVQLFQPMHLASSRATGTSNGNGSWVPPVPMYM